MQVIGDSRYSFIAQFLWGSAIFAFESAQIEKNYPENPSEHVVATHRAMLTAVIMQCVAAVEALSAEIPAHGIRFQLGSNGSSPDDKLLLSLADEIDNTKPLERFQRILEILGKSRMSRGDIVWQNMQLLMELRNAITHYKSKWGRDMNEVNFIKLLKTRNFIRPSFVNEYALFFPQKVLGADCAAWSIRTSIKFIDEFYKCLGVENCIAPYMEQIKELEFSLQK